VEGDLLDRFHSLNINPIMTDHRYRGEWTLSYSLDLSECFEMIWLLKSGLSSQFIIINLPHTKAGLVCHHIPILCHLCDVTTTSIPQSTESSWLMEEVDREPEVEQESEEELEEIVSKKTKESMIRSEAQNYSKKLAKRGVVSSPPSLLPSSPH
jgi:hypothetical protein